MSSKKTGIDEAKLDRIVAQARKDAQARDLGYRERALKLYPWVCGRCGRDFTRENLRELTVHHRNHDHDFNPPDGSNWELLCVYCHDNEHSRYSDHTGIAAADAEDKVAPATATPFAGLRGLLGKKD
jgi:5-methylcytosine-specific restriction endonuclease McrA